MRLCFALCSALPLLCTPVPAALAEVPAQIVEQINTVQNLPPRPQLQTFEDHVHHQTRRLGVTFSF